MTSPVGAVGYVDPTVVPQGVDVVSKNDTSSLLNPQAFLQLLVAQLQYQDPSQPADMSSFMNQTAMLSQVQSTNAMQDTLQTLMQSQQAQTATTMVGKTVTYTDASGASHTGEVTGATSLTHDPQLLIGGHQVALSSVTGVSGDVPST
jgi:flagellar basal-body rod modification protein FlgD